MEKHVTIKREEKTVVRFSGVNQAAKALGCSPTHLTYILHGQRKPGPKLAAKMNRLGINWKHTAE